MTYSEVITELERDVVTDGLWASDSEKYKDLRNLLYAAAVSIASELPLSEFSLATSTQAVANEVPEKAPLPTDLFSYRKDKGVRSLTISGSRYMVSQQNSYESVSSLASNTAFLEATDMIFTVDPHSQSIFGVNLGPSVDVEYLAMFTEPAATSDPTIAGDLEDTKYPLKNKNIREAIGLVAAHLQGNRKRDGQGAQFNMVLTNMYGGRGNA